MTPELSAALIGLGLAVIGGITALVVWLFREAPGYLKRVLEAQVKSLEQKIEDQSKDLQANTKLTEDVRRQTNGALAKARDDLTRVTWERDAYRDMVRYVNTRQDGRAILLEYAERRKVRHNDAELEALIAAAPPPSRENAA